MVYSVEYLSECFDLCRVSYVLTWKTRPQHHFAHSRAHSRFNTMFAGKVAGLVHRNSGLEYVKIKLHEKTLLAHRAIWAIIYGEMPTYPIDHLDGNGLNNRPENLRLCSDDADFNNSRNRRRASNNTSGRTGVYWRKERNRWVAKGRIYNKDDTFEDFTLGSFVKFEDAVLAREKWEIKNGFIYRE